MDYDGLKKLRVAIESDVADKYSADPSLRPKIGGAEYQAEVNERLAKAGPLLDSDTESADRKTAQDAEASRPSRVMEAKRRSVESTLRDEYAGDEKRSYQIGGARYQSELAKRYKDEGVHTEADSGGKTGASGVLARYGVAAIIGEIGSAARSGAQAGKAVGDVAESVNGAVQAAGQGFVKAGTSALNLFLSPFGKAGTGIGSIVGGLSSGLLSVLGTGGTLAATGLKLGGSLAGGILGGLTGVLGTGIGAVLGGIIGGGLPGAIAGGLLGGGLVAGAAGLLSSLAGTVSSSLGQIVSGIGTVIGDVDTSIASTLGNVKAVLGDLISTGKEWALATASISRNGGLSLGQAGVASSFANILTGSPAGLNGLYSGFGHNAAYVGAVAGGFGVRGVNGSDPLSLVQGAYSRYTQIGQTQPGPMANINQNILLKGLFGSSADAIGSLFSAGADTLRMVLRTAQATAMTPTQTRQSLVLNFQLNAVQAQLDSLKLKFLTDLMPAIQTGMKMLTGFLSANTGKILSSFSTVGEFLAVKLPTYLEIGLGALYRFGIGFAQSLPKIFDFGLKVILSGLQVVQGIAKEIGGNVFLRRLSPTLAQGLTSFGSISPVQMGLTTAQGQEQLTLADRRRKQAAELQDKIFGREEGLRNHTSTESSDPATALADIAKQKETVKRLMGQADAADAEARRLNPLQGRVQGFSDGLANTLRHSRDSVLPAVSGALGTERARQGYWDQLQRSIEDGIKQGMNGSSVRVKSEISVAPTPHFIAEVAENNAEMFIRGISESSS